MVKSPRLALVLICMFSIFLSSCGSGGESAVGRGNLWTWKGGTSTLNQPGTYGSLGAADMNNIPGARSDTVSWVDNNGFLWLFGGYGYDKDGNIGYLNDMWMFNLGAWTWESGANTHNAVGTYPPATPATPGARKDAVSWTDTSFNMWLFGGYGYDSTSSGRLNDLWKFDIIALTWTLVKGSDVIDQKGTYGTINTADVNNIPGGRSGAVSWRDSSNNLWLFGGYGYDSAGNIGYLNDLWKFDSAGTSYWTWKNGSNTRNQEGTYSTPGSNVPGAREGAVSWIDSSNNLWLFGGYGYDSAGALGYLNDLWKFDGTNWTWMNPTHVPATETNVINQQGIYDATLGTPGPGARYYASAWVDISGNMWLFGGYGYDHDKLAHGLGYLNDMWKFDGTNWTWMRGANFINMNGIYGPYMGLPLASTTPGARFSAVAWAQNSGYLFLFGGYGYDSVPADGLGYLNDLWRYTQ
jgi:hypothetical protein